MQRRTFLALSLTLPVVATRGYAARSTSASTTGHVSTVVDLGTGADFTRLTVSERDLYILDRGAWRVRRFILNADGHALLFSSVMRWKEGADKVIMGRPQDLNQSGPLLLVLDDLGSLWRYWGPDYLRTMVPLRLQSNQGQITSLATDEQKMLYLLDAERQAIWSYHTDASGSYTQAPQALIGPGIAALSGAIRLSISAQSLLVLRTDGQILWIPRTGRGARVQQTTLPFTATGLWATPTRSTVLASLQQGVAVLNERGQLLKNVSLESSGVGTLRDVAMTADQRIYLLEAQRVLNLHLPFTLASLALT